MKEFYLLLLYILIFMLGITCLSNFKGYDQRLNRLEMYVEADALDAVNANTNAVNNTEGE